MVAPNDFVPRYNIAPTQKAPVVRERDGKRELAHIDNLRKAGHVIGVIAWALIADAIAELSRDRRNDEPLN